MANPRESKPVLHTKKHIARLERERQQTRWILISFISIVVIIIGLLIYGYLDVKYLQARRAIAKVGDASLTIGEWQARVRMERNRLLNMELTYQQYAQYFGMDLSSQIQQIEAQLNSPTTLGQTVLDRMIDEELIRQEAARRGITVSEADIDKAIQESYQYFPNGTSTPTITPTSITFPTLSADTLAIVTITPTPTLESTLESTGSPTVQAKILTPTATLTPTLDLTASPTAAIPPTATPTIGPTATITPTASITPTATPYTLDAFQQKYKAGVDSLIQLGLTEAQVRQLYATNLLREKLFEVITADVPRTQEQVWARHILVKDEATAKQVEDRLAKGEDFATVAKEMSTDTGSAVNGGDLGWFGKGAMIPEFETAAFSLKVGEISQPIQSQYGYHIIQVLAHENVPLDASAYEQARQTAFSDWLTKARDEYKVETFNNWQSIVPTDPASLSASQ